MLIFSIRILIVFIFLGLNCVYSKRTEIEIEKDEIVGRIFEILSQDSKTQVLDKKSESLIQSLTIFDEEIKKIYQEEFKNLKLNPKEIYEDDKKNTNSIYNFHDGDDVFYDWFAFGLTIRKILNSFTNHLSTRLLETTNLNITSKCMLSMLASLEELKLQKEWIIKLLDSSGKPELHSILEGSIISLGGYDQCLNVVSPKLLNQNPQRIYGKYCLVKYNLPLPRRPKEIHLKTKIFNFTATKLEGTAIEDFSRFAHALYEHKPRMGICIPSGCTEDDLQLILDTYFINSTTSANVDYCRSKVDFIENKNFLNNFGIPYEQLTCLQTTVLFVYFFIILLIIIGTILEVFIILCELSEEKKKESIDKKINGFAAWNRNRKSLDQIQPVTQFIQNTYNFNVDPSLRKNNFFENDKSFEMHNLDATAKRRLYQTGSFRSTVMSDPIDLYRPPISNKVKIFNLFTISKKNLVIQAFFAFSLYENCKKLFSTKTSKGSEFEFFNGIRVISMLWIILTHTYLLPIKSTMINSRKFLQLNENHFFQFINNGWVLVDSFFFMSAFLVTYNQLKTMKRTNGKINLVRLILNRLVRISPCLWFIISIMFVLPIFIEGPLLNDYLGHQIMYCQQSWWLNFVFINNWFPVEKICLLHTWYLSADMQLYFFSLFVIVILYRWPKIGCPIVVTGIFLSMTGTFFYTYINNYPPTVIFNTPIEKVTLEDTAKVYTITLPHLAPYCLGILAGFILHEKRIYNLSIYLVISLWVSAISFAFIILMWTHEWNTGEPFSPISSALYASWHRFGWGSIVFWISFSCSTNNAGFINTFLSMNIFKFLGKISFATYLIHFLVIWGRLSYARDTITFNHYTMVCEYILNVSFSLVCAILLHLFIELPATNLYNVLFKGSFEFLTIKIPKRNIRKNNFKNSF